MKWGELRQGGYVSVLTDCVVMTPKQQRVILVEDDRASGQGIICKTRKEMRVGIQESYVQRTDRYAQALYLSAGFGDYYIR